MKKIILVDKALVIFFLQQKVHQLTEIVTTYAGPIFQFLD